MKKLRCLFLLTILTSAHCAKILGIFNIPSRSHHILGESLLKGLASKGHEVTMYSPFSSKNPPENYKEKLITNILGIKEDNMLIILKLQDASFLNKAVTAITYTNSIENILFNHTETQKLIESKIQYDLAIVLWYGNDAILSLAQHIANHTIVFSPVGSNYPIEKLTRASAPLSYVPNLFPHFPDEMNFIERLMNTLTSFVYTCVDYPLSYHKNAIINKYLPNNTHSTNQLYEHVSLVFLNTHFSLESTRPYVPQMIQVGGLHLEEPSELTGNLKLLMDESEEGVIFFSLGTNIKSADMDEEKLKAIIECFSKLPYKVLWKFENSNLSNLPKNLQIDSWYPQKDLLGHKNLKLFLTHGGLLSTIEAVYNGVPMIGIPIFADQDGNVNDGVMKGYMVRLSYSDISEDTLRHAIVEVMQNPKYRKNVQRRSRIFRDQPLKPLDKAVYWVEYVLRHDGAHHLKTSAFKLHWTQQYLLDVIAILFSTFAVFLYATQRIIKFVYRFLLTRGANATIKEKVKAKLT